MLFYGQLKKKYVIWARLQKMSGWGCNPATGALNAPDEVWEQEIKACPQAREFRLGALPHCFELREIFEGVTASGDFAVYPGTLTSGHSISLICKIYTTWKLGKVSKNSIIQNTGIIC